MRLEQTTLTEYGYRKLQLALICGDYGQGWELYEAKEEGELSKWVSNTAAFFWVKPVEGGYKVVARAVSYDYLDLDYYATFS